MKRLGMALLLILAFATSSLGQVNGDYQTTATGTWNWTTTANWQKRVAGAWVVAPEYPGAIAGTGTVNILNNTTVTVNANIPNSIGALRINGGNQDSYLQFNPGFSLTVTGLTYLNSTSGNDEKSIFVDAGIFRTGSLDVNSGNNDVMDAYLRISTGTATVDSDITLNNTNVRTYILFTGTGTLFVGGNMSGGGITSTVGGGTNPTSGTVNYNGSGAQSVGVYPYYNLTLSGSGAKTTAGVTVNNILSMEETATASVAPTYGAAATLQYNTATSRTAGVEWITPFAATGGVIIANTGVITMNAAKVFNASVPLTINSGAALATNNFQLTLGGNFINSGGAFTAGSSPIVIAYTMAAQSIAGFTTTGLVSMTKTAGTATLTGNVNGGALTINGAGGTLNLGAALSHTISGTWTRTNGTLNGGSSTLLLGGSVSGVGGTFTANTGTVEYNGAGLQDVGALTYYKLTVSGGSIKTMLGNVTVNNTLTLTSGILRIGNFNLTINGNPTNSIQGTLNSTSMVETNGTGVVVRNALAATPILFPIGSNGNYAPATINSTSATTGTITVSTIQSGALGSKYVGRYWDVITTTGGKTITATFQYDPTEITVTPTFQKYKPAAGAWQNPVGTQSFGANTFTITGTTNITTTTTSWTAGAIGTYYSYQTGDWNTPTTWTSDPGGTTQVGSTVPGTDDVAVILSGRTVSLPANIATTGLDVTINAGGFLNMSTYSFTGGLAALRGQGTLNLASVNFPTVTTNTLVNIGGGTVEYNNAGSFTLPGTQTTYNNLTINAPAGVIATQMNNFSLNGNLYVKNGTYRINDNTAGVRRFQLIINGNVTVDNGASLTVGTGVTNMTTNPYGILTVSAPPFINYYDAQSHRVVVNGDFTNNGTVRFTNLTYPIYDAFPPMAGATAGFATVYFRGATNNTLTCNNTTDFYNLVLDKGIDQTFSLTVYSSAYTNFRLFGANTAGGDQLAPATQNNPDLKKALWIRTGTLKLQGLAIIPSLSEGTCGDGATPNSDFYVPANGALVLDGTDVIVLSTADDYREVNLAYGVAGGTGLVNGVGRGGCSSFSILGKLQINNGYFSTRESGGFITWDWASGQFIINGGIVDAKQYRAAGVLGGLASFTQTGGLFILRGRFLRTPTAYTAISNLTDFSTATLNTTRSAAAINAAFGTFNLNYAANVFNMSGGTIRVYDVCGNAAAEQKAFEILSATGNINVISGTLEIIPTTGTGGDPANYYIESNARLKDLTINRVSGAAVVGLRTYPLTLFGNLNLTSGDFNANSLDVSISGNFTLANGTTYTTGTNRTIFNGGGVQSFIVNIGSALNLNKLILQKPTLSEVRLSGTQATLNITDSLRIFSGTFRTYIKTVNCSGNLENNGISSTTTGYLVMNNDAARTITSDGTGVFTNLELNKPTAGTADVTLLSNITVNGDLKFAGAATGYKKLNLQDKNLLLGVSATITGADVNRFAYTMGQVGNASISKLYSTTSKTFTFPVGAPSTSHLGVPVYTPATISFGTDPTTYGTITVIPVGAEHYATSVKNRCLTYYWHVKSNGFAGIAAGYVSHSYTYSDLDVATGAGITESEYVPARFDLNSVTWANGTSASINTATNVMDGPWLSGVDNLDGDYTAGDNNPTSPFGAPKTYYSYNSGWWGDVANWSLTDHTTYNQPAVPPGASDIVIIGNGHAITLNTNNTVANTDIRNCANLQIKAGASLDIGYNPGCNFTVVSSVAGGNGLFRLTTSWTSGYYFTFPSGDFSDFNANLGTTELYSTNPAVNTTYWLPNNINKYGNLIISPIGGSNIIFGNTDVLIYGSCTIKGQNADSWFCPTWNTNYPDPNVPTVFNIPRVAKTITVNGNMDIQGGSFGWYGGGGGGAQNVVVNGNVIVASGAAINVWASNTSQRLSIGGDLINNANNIINPGSVCRSYVCLNAVPVEFFGNTDATVFTANNTAYAAASGTGYGFTDPANPLHRSATIFSTVTLNKGSSQTTALSFTGGNISTPVNGWLTLQNGTLRYLLTDPRTDFTISTTTAITIPGTSGLEINLAGNANNTNVLIANANANNNDLYLDGKLTIANTTVYIGPVASPANNNDIEYGGGGLSEIDMQGGALIVNGQIRMNSAQTAGVLMYRQSGSSSVVINGQAAVTSHAKLEIYNPGSIFNMSGTSTLTIVRGGGVDYGDLYLRPASSTVSGTSTVYFTQTPTIGPVVDAVQNYQLDATVPLNNLTITGKTAATARNATVKLLINPITINGDLTISNANSFFDANTTYNIAVTINGNLNNSGTYNRYNNTTTFNGGAQSILGTTATSFYNLVINPVTSLTLNANTTVANDLTLTSGTLICGAYTVNVAGNLANNANYTDTNTGVVLNGAALQHISGTGTFGRLTLNNAAGARLNNDITLNNDLVLTTGIFDINKYILTLGVSSNITGAPFSSSKMIATDGVFSTFGVKKVFGIIAAPTTFTFPIGTASKYTPAVLSITRNDNVGWIRITNINSSHPGVFDPANVLKYFWEVESFGISNFSGNLVFNYLDADVIGGPEINYIAAHLIIPGTSWSKVSTVDPVLNTITFSYTLRNSISGEYTAGLDPAFPADVPEYTSIANGIWTDETNWVQTGGTAHACPSGGPNGFIVNINHIITANADYCQAYRTVINSELRIVSPFTGHNLGTVSGNGKLYLESATFPAGRYNSFLDCAGNGTIEYGGPTNYTIIADLFSTIPRLYFTGSGTKSLPINDLTICKRLLIDGATLDNTVNNSKLTIQGTMERINSGVFTSGSGANATVSFAGSAAQTVGGATLGNFTGTSAFNNLEINNTAGLTINNPGSVEVKRNLLLTSGLINTSSTATLTITNTTPGCITPAGGSATSYVNGPLTKRINQGDNFFFPIGKGASVGNKLSLSASQTGTILWTAEYFTPNSTYATLSAPLSYVNSKDFWTISAPSGSQAIVNLNWDPSSDLTPLMTQNGLTDMRVSYYNPVTPSWEEVASGAIGNNNNGTVSTSSRVTIPAAGASNYTVACINVTKPKARLNPAGAVCGVAGIPITFSGVDATNLNFIINYKKGGVAQVPVTVSSLPYTLPTDAIGTTYQLTSFTYNNPPHSAPNETGVVDPAIITTYTVPTTADAGTDQSLCGASSVTLAGNLPGIGTGLWSVFSGAGGSFVDPTVRNTVFNGTNGTAYVLRWTISNGGCTSFDDVNITFPLLAVQPAGFSASTTPVCQGTSGVIYNVPNDPLVTYIWSYSGLNANIIGSGNSITIDYLGNATSGDLSVKASNGCGDSAPLILPITVKQQPTATLSIDAGFNPLCDGDNTQLTVTFAGGTSPYGCDIYNGAATENIINVVSPYTFIPSIANHPIWLGPGVSTTYTYSITNVTSANGCSNIGSNTVDVVVYKIPETGPEYHIPNGFGL